jgi:hypothetical protein
VPAATNATKATNEMQIVHVFVKNAFDEVWAYLQPFKGHDLAHIRVFSSGDNDEMHPTKQGLALRVEDLAKLGDAVASLIAAVEGRGA